MKIGTYLINAASLLNHQWRCMCSRLICFQKLKSSKLRWRSDFVLRLFCNKNDTILLEGNKTKVLSWNLIVSLFWDHLMWYLMWSVGIFKTRHLQLLNFLVCFANFLLRSVICEFWWSCILAKWKNTRQSFIHTAYALYICRLTMLNKLLVLPPQRRRCPWFCLPQGI